MIPHRTSENIGEFSSFAKHRKWLTSYLRFYSSDNQIVSGSGETTPRGRDAVSPHQGRVPGRCVHRCRLIQTRLLSAALIAAALAGHSVPGVAASQKYQSGDWVAECEAGGGNGTPECSIMVPFWTEEKGQKGSFALAVML